MNELETRIRQLEDEVKRLKAENANLSEKLSEYINECLSLQFQNSINKIAS